VASQNLSVTPEQCRAGRALLNWTQADLERASKVSRKALVEFEQHRRHPYSNTLSAVRAALERGGIVFLEADQAGGPGVRLGL
jgi:transcriptional regulator with XRE-family HTH domain